MLARPAPPARSGRERAHGEGYDLAELGPAPDGATRLESVRGVWAIIGAF